MFYGIITDTFPICGSTKKNYLIICGIIFTVNSVISGLYNGDNPWPLIFNMSMSMVASAIMDVVVDGLMVA